MMPPVPVRILFATNGSPESLSAGNLVRALARADSVSITINVCDSVEFLSTAASGETGHRDPQGVAEAETAAFEQAGFQAAGKVAFGAPAVQILETTRDGEFDLIVVGAGSSSWLGNMLMGSTSLRVLHGAHIPVLVVHRYTPSGDQLRVVMATDGSDDAEIAARTLAAVADPTKVRVKVVSVSGVVSRAAAQYDDWVPSDEVFERLQSHARSALAGAASILEPAGFAVTTQVLDGQPVRQILEEAEHADLVVLGSRGLGPVSRLALGSVSDQVARLTPAALVCRRKEP